jgi:hypothetical protein
VVEPDPFRTDWAGRSLKQSPNFINDYEQTASARRQETAGYSGKQPGDRARAAEAVIKAVQSPTPPRHLVLGRQGFDNVETQLHSMLQEVDLWKATSLSADYPTTAGASSAA